MLGRGRLVSVRRAWAVLTDALGHFNDDDGWAMASHVALSALMAFFPFVIFVTALAGFIGEERLAGTVANLLFATWPKEVAGPIAAEVNRVINESHGGLLTLSAVVAVYLASNGVEAVRTALNRAYRVVERRSFLFLRLQSLGFVLAGAVASLALAFMALLTPSVFAWLESAVPWLQPFAAGVATTRYVVTGLLLIIILAVSHLWLPAARPSASHLWPGIAATLVLWVLSAWIFAFYLERFANLAATYAGLASVFTAIFFLYVVAALAIFGGEFNASLGRLRNHQIG
jgi:membrane protein